MHARSSSARVVVALAPNMENCAFECHPVARSAWRKGRMTSPCPAAGRAAASLSCGAIIPMRDLLIGPEVDDYAHNTRYLYGKNRDGA